jgi:hypothetical protein
MLKGDTNMRTKLVRPIAVVGVFIAFMVAGEARAASITIALVPTVAPSPKPAREAKTFTIAYRSDSGKTSTAKLTFDLQAIPVGATIECAKLRLFPDAEGTSQQVFILSDIKDTDNRIGQLYTKKPKQAVESLGDGLVRTLENLAGKTLDLYLWTNTPRSIRSYYSHTADTSANRPRLIVSWADTAPPITRAGAQLRYRGNPDDMTPWKNDMPKGAVLSQLGFDQILAGPVFRRDEILLIAKPMRDAKPMLYGMGWNGSKRWASELPALGKPTASWKYLHVDAQDRLLAFANDGTIRLFDFGDDGRPTDPVVMRVDGMLLSNRPVVSAGGMVTFRNDAGYVYTLSPSPGLRDLWRSPINVGLSPPPVLSPRHGDGLVYVIAVPDAGNPGLLVVDAVRGEVRFPPAQPKGTTEAFPTDSRLSNYKDFHPPFVVEGSEHDWVFLSGFGESKGVLEGYTDFTNGDPAGRWKEPKEKESKDNRISRCVAPLRTSNAEPVIYCVQGGQLRGFKLDGSQSCPSTIGDEGLNATSNLVADGAGNIYFWDETAGDSGVFYGFDSQCVRLFSQPLKGLPKKPDGSDVLELRVGPHGVIYATGDKVLFAIQPTRAGPVSVLVANTRYATLGPMEFTASLVPPTDGPVILAAIGGKVSFGDFQVPAGADVTCSAGNGVSFGPGFTVKKGGVLRCGIDVTTVLTAPGCREVSRACLPSRTNCIRESPARLFEEKLRGIQSRSNLWFGTDGTLCAGAIGAKADLRAVLPQYALGEETKDTNIYSPTHLWIDGTAGQGKEWVLKAGGSVLLGKGFAVQKGTTLNVQVGVPQ